MSKVYFLLAMIFLFPIKQSPDCYSQEQTTKLLDKTADQFSDINRPAGRTDLVLFPRIKFLFGFDGTVSRQVGNVYLRHESEAMILMLTNEKVVDSLVLIDRQKNKRTCLPFQRLILAEK
ncbi:MAG TPA: hypothetical protein PKD64_12050 [Pirellulaceae bacterium]|nr:hypothetical protein [Pirellulaceae bacterium]HMO92918.1 hypothetical protein [Pirellulaceae bacterium]HMP71061.1 hypothetical protein [Pirellulaceae bacterium]